VTPLRALVLDDEAAIRKYLAELLRATARVDPVGVVGSIAEATQAMSADLEIEAAFVDVRLVERAGDQAGLRWARALAAQPDAPLIVLATALAEHAVAGFELGAVDYLLKPFTPSRVATCVERLLARRTPRPATLPSRLMARDGARLVFLPVAGILAFEAAERLVFVHHAEGRFLVDLSLAAVEQQLGERVLRTHRNWLVVPGEVRELSRATGELVVTVGATLVVPVSRDRGAAIRAALTRGALGSRP
jgi:DNA-binding LytR/AlgR family response regulator